MARPAALATSALAALGLLVGLAATGSAPAQAVAGALTFDGAGVGPIADGTTPCPAPGAARNVTFTVTGMEPGAPSDVRITGLVVVHSYVGDLVVTLIAPDGTSHVLFGRTWATTAAGHGDASDLAGPYTFADDATDRWWPTALTAGVSQVIPDGAYRTSALGGPGSTGADTSLTGAFSAVTDPNGTWTLRFTDGCESDTGAVGRARLELAPKCAPAEDALATAQTNAVAAGAALTTATAETAAAGQALAAADKGLKKAKKALRKAKRHGDAAKIKKAKKKVKAARKALTAAKQDAAAAEQKLNGARAADAQARQELGASQVALAACRA